MSTTSTSPVLQPGLDAQTAPPSGRCHILRLPDELLVQILELPPVPLWRYISERLVSSNSDPDTTKTNRPLHVHRWALTLVCRRFNTIVTPLLYTQLAPSADAVPLLHRTLNANPELRQHCRELVFDLKDPRWEVDPNTLPNDKESKRLLDYGMELAGWLVNTEILRFDGGQGSVPGWPDLTSRSVPFNMTDDFLVYLYPDMQASIAGFTNLETLEIVGVINPGAYYDQLLLQSFLMSSFLESVEEIKGLSRYTTLYLRDRVDLRTLHAYCLAPSALRKFKFSGPEWYPNDEFFRYYRGQSRTTQFWLGMVCTALKPQAHSLESIRIGSVFEQTLRVPSIFILDSREYLLDGVDFTCFTRLTFLSLSYWMTGTLASEALKFLAPNLETFEWNFNADDGRPLYLNDFQQPEENFLRTLAQVAVQKHIPLRTISVVFSPRPALGVWLNQYLEPGYLTKTDRVICFEYPWHRMDRLARELGGQGISLVYNKPTVTTEECDRIARNVLEQRNIFVDEEWYGMRIATVQS